MDRLSLVDIEHMVNTMATVAITNEAYFSELDAAAGDADFGVSLANGFRAVTERWTELNRCSISSFLTNVGVIITSHVGGCSGPLWGTCFIRAGKVAQGKSSLGLIDIIAMLHSAIEGIMARGGARLGNKTMLDAMAPAVISFEECSQTAQGYPEAFQAAAEAAARSVESTRAWVAMSGRQSQTGDRSKGTLDPGMVAISTMLQALAATLKASRDAAAA